MKQNYREMVVLPEDWIKWQFKDGEEQPPQPCWSGDFDPPNVGDFVRVSMNGLGNGIVRGYFIEYGWLGLLVSLVNPPQWWLDQNNLKAGSGPYPFSHIFGIECKPINGDGSKKEAA